MTAIFVSVDVSRPAAPPGHSTYDGILSQFPDAPLTAELTARAISGDWQPLAQLSALVFRHMFAAQAPVPAALLFGSVAEAQAFRQVAAEAGVATLAHEYVGPPATAALLAIAAHAHATALAAFSANPTSGAYGYRLAPAITDPTPPAEG